MLLDQSWPGSPMPDPRAASQAIADEVLLLAIKAGDRRAFGRLVDRHVGPAFELALNMLDDEDAAEQIVADAVIALRTPDAEVVALNDGIATWLAGTVIRACIAAAAKRGETHGRTAARPDLRAALQAVEPRCRATLILHYTMDLAPLQVAHLIDTDEATVGTLLWSGRRVLRRFLSGEGDESRRV